MKVLTVLAIGALGLWAMAACKVSGAVQCQEDGHCDLETGGACLRNPDTKRRWCSYPAANCPAGFRWSDLDVGDGVAGTCVPVLALDRTAPVIIDRSPSPDTQGVSPTTLISVKFSEAIDPESVTADSLRLVDQGGNPVEASFVTTGADVILTPEVPLDPRLDYRITVTPALTDFADNGLPDEASWGFRTKEAEWSQPVLLEQEQSKKAVFVDAASAGDVVAVTWAFQSCTGSTCAAANEIWAAVRKSGTWGPAIKLATTGPRLQEPRVGVSPEGVTVVLWSQEGVESPGKLFSARHDGASWSEPTMVSEFRDGRLIISSITPAPDGALDVVWFDKILHHRARFWESRFIIALGWQSPVLLGESLANVTTLPSVAPGATPLMVRVDRLEEHLVASRRMGGTWSSEVPLAAISSQPAFAHVAASGEHATAIWATDHVYSRSFVNGAWEAVTQIDAAQAPLPLPAIGPKQAPTYLANGTVLALWTTENEVWQAARPQNQPWGPSFAIDAAAQPAEGLRLVAGRRRALALWRNTDLIANEYNEATGWRGPGAAESQAAAISGSTIVYDESTNSFLAVWLQSNVAGLVDVVASNYR